MIPGWCLGGRAVSSWDLACEGEAFATVAAPCTVASALRSLGRWKIGDPADFDRQTWIFRATVTVGHEDGLYFEGLTESCEVWLDGVHVATAVSQFVPLVVPLPVASHVVLELRCKPVDMSRKKPRARWRSRIFDDPQRRWVRASAIGHTPTFGPSFATVGPWRDVRFCKQLIAGLGMRALYVDGNGTVQVRAKLNRPGELKLRLGDVFAVAAGTDIDLRVSLRDVRPWMPHTHGEQSLYSVELCLPDGEAFTTRVAFRATELTSGHEVRINGQPVFCRGTNWLPTDCVAMGGDASPELARLAAAGTNMLRVPANALYESDAFYQRCTELGILVWQDFMFASLDFPFEDDAFADACLKECSSFLRRTQHQACLAVFSANSEVRMQALMMGVTPPDIPFYSEVLPRLVRELRPDVPFVAGTPGADGEPGRLLEPRQGPSHYYGVGVYQRPLSDARLSGVRFAPECLAFAQRPGLESRAAWHEHPWQERVLRFEAGASDFADANEHYVRLLFGVDPLVLRTNDRPTYEALLDIVPGLLMHATYAEWRTGGVCHGGLVWIMRDTWPSTGLGVVDADGRAKPAFHYLRRAFQSRAVFLRDEGLNGLDVYVVNDRGEAATGTVTLELYRDDLLLETFEQSLSVPAYQRMRVPAATITGRFSDLTFSYRFGPRPYDLVVARFSGCLPAFYFPGGEAAPRRHEIGLSATRDGAEIVLTTEKLAHTVVIEGGEPGDNYFHLAPRESRRLHVGEAPVRVQALNGLASQRL